MEVRWEGSTLKLIAIDYGTGYDPSCRRLENITDACAWNPEGVYNPYSISAVLELLTCDDLGGCDTWATASESDLLNAKKTVVFVIAKKGDVVYIIRPVYDTANAAFLLLVPSGAEQVYAVGYDWSSGKMVTVLLDSGMNVVARLSTVVVSWKDENGKVHEIHVPATIAPLVAAIIIAALGAGTAVGWAAFNYLSTKEQSEAEKVKAEAARVNAETLKYIAEKAESVMKQEGKVDMDKFMKVIIAVSGSTAAAGGYSKVAPAETPPNNVQDWASKMFGFLKDVGPFIIGALGLIVLLFKFNVLGMVMDAVRDILSSFRRRR